MTVDTNQGAASAAPFTCEWCGAHATRRVLVRPAAWGMHKGRKARSRAVHAWCCDGHLPVGLMPTATYPVAVREARGVNQLGLWDGDDV